MNNKAKYYSEGDVNYIISSIVWNLFRKRPSYGNGNCLVGVMECAKLEFYRKLLSEYEDGKEEQNGSI